MSILKTLGYTGSLKGSNGSDIKNLKYDDLNPHARYVINKIKRNPKEQFWDPTRDNVTTFENKMKDLPDGGSYKEFTVLATDASYSETYSDLAATVVPQPGIPGGAKARKQAMGAREKGDTGVAAGGGAMGVFASGQMRIVWDSTNGRFFYTPTHYVGFPDSTVNPPKYYNPFFLVTDIDAESHLRHGPGF